MVQLQGTVDGRRGQEEVNVTALQCGGLIEGQDLSAELAGDDGGGKFFRTVLPISSNHKGRVKMTEKLKQMSQKLRIEWRLEVFAGLEVDLDQKEISPLSFHPQSCPTIALLSVGVDVMDEMLG